MARVGKLTGNNLDLQTTLIEYLTVLLEYLDLYSQWQGAANIWEGLGPERPIIEVQLYVSIYAGTFI